MTYMKTPGLVIKETKYGEGNKILTLLTPKYGKIQAGAKGIRSYKSKLAAGCSLFCYTDFILRPGRSGYYYISSAERIHTFSHLSEDIEKLALAAYCSDVIALSVEEGQEATQILRLALNTLVAVDSFDLKDQIKPAFELRLMSELGFSPELTRCGHCGRDQNLNKFSIPESSVFCGNCNYGLPLSHPVLMAMRYITQCPLKQLFSFSMSDRYKTELADLCEGYLVFHLGRRPKSLDFYHSLQ
jgi:DNA repair protein RecO (recombination protein O)